MRTKIILILTLFVLSLATINCDRVFSPFSPDVPKTEQSGNAVLTGTIFLSSSDTDFSSILIGIQGTSLQTVADGSGNFQIENLPLGDIVVEVTVQTQVSNLAIQGVITNEEIKIRIEIQAGNTAVLVDQQRNRRSSGELQLEIRPDKWNVAWTDGAEEVNAMISGEGFDTIKAETVRMVGPEGEIATPYTYDVGGVYFIAKFYQKDAIKLIADPKSGESYEIHVTGELGDGSPFDLSDTITIVGKKTGVGELALDIRPDKWNVAWTGSAEEVNAMIRGEGFDTIKAETVRMVGPEGEIATPYTYDVGGVYFIAKFYQKDAIKLIADPKSGESYEIHVTGELGDGSPFDLSDTITIVGKK